MTYAKGTEVSVEKSRVEIETILRRYGATHFGYMTSPHKSQVAFEAKGRRIRFDLPLPDRKAFLRDGRGSPRGPAQIEKAWEQGCRERWRALVLCIKAKLESVESNIESFEEAFLAHIVLPNGETVGAITSPRLAAIYAGSDVPLLPAPGRAS